jgi:diacylglycerol O-acyltransferase
MPDRLTLLDLAFFVLETAERPMNVGPLIVLTPPPRRGKRAFADVLHERMMRRPAGPPFDRKLDTTSFTSFPALVPDPAFDLAQHVHRLTLPAPGTLDALYAKICELHPRLLDRSRPLWDFHLIDGLEGGRVALYARMHHGIVDGVGFMKILAQWFSDSPRDRGVRALWEGVAGATTATARTEQSPLLHGTGKLWRMGADGVRTAVSFGQLIWQQGKATLGAGAGVPLPFVATPGVLKAAPSAHRTFAHCVLSLGAIKAAGKLRDATVNDMLLTLLDMALVRYLGDKGSAPGAPLVADVPVALGGRGPGGNRIALVQIPLGAPDLDPVARLDAIRSRTQTVKAQLHGGAADGAMLHSVIAHGLPALFERLGMSEAPLLANLVVSNPVGVTEPRYLMGAEVEFALPISVVAPGQVLNITGVNYGDRYEIAFLALAEAVPDVELLAKHTGEAFATLASSLRGAARKRAGAGRKTARRRKGKAAGG